MVLTTLENMEISGNLSILENSGNLKYTQRILVYQMMFFVMQSETDNKLTCKYSCTCVSMLLKKENYQNDC